MYEHSVGVIPSIYYSPDAVEDDVVPKLLDYVERTGNGQAAWIQLKARRLQCWGDFPQVVSGSSVTDLSAPMPAWLDVMIDSLIEQGVFAPEQRPNNVLINQYDANEGILHHTDGPAYHDKVAILSLGSECIMSFRKKLTSEEIGSEFAGDVCSVVLAPRSLLIFEGDAYSKHMHGIEIDQPVQRVEEHGPCANLHLVSLPTDADGNHVVRALFSVLSYTCAITHYLLSSTVHRWCEASERRSRSAGYEILDTNQELMFERESWLCLRRTNSDTNCFSKIFSCVNLRNKGEWMYLEYID